MVNSIISEPATASGAAARVEVTNTRFETKANHSGQVIGEFRERATADESEDVEAVPFIVEGASPGTFRRQRHRVLTDFGYRQQRFPLLLFCSLFCF